MTFPEYESFDGLGLAELVKKRIISPEELLNAAIERIEYLNPKLNAVITPMFDIAKKHIQALPAGPFQGVPIVLKDLLADYKGAPIHYGSRFAINHVSTVDSEIVKRFKTAGVVVLGKTNVPEFGLSPTTEPVAFGPCLNPWDLTRSSGGSSGGSAAAVASRMVPIAHGGDGGGSLRIPAAYCGVFGFKPSRGRTPTGPLIMRAWLGCVTEHVLTRSVRDSAAMLDALSGFEIGSPISLPDPNESYLLELEKPPERLRIALIERPFFPADIHADYKEAVNRAGKLCQDLGHHVEPVVFELDSEEIMFSFLILMMAETGGGLKNLIKLIGRSPKSNELEPATALLCKAGDKFTASDYARVIWRLDMAARQVAEFYEKYDVILTPTMPFHAPKIGLSKPLLSEKIAHKIMGFLTPSLMARTAKEAAAKKFAFMAYTGLFNIGGQPAMSVPLYWDKNNLPIGIQFAGKFKEDAILLRLARQLEIAQPWDDKKPPI